MRPLDEHFNISRCICGANTFQTNPPGAPLQVAKEPGKLAAASLDMSKDKKKKKSPLICVIEPSKCIVEDLEILAFESDEQLQYYTIWHEALHAKDNNNGLQQQQQPQLLPQQQQSQRQQNHQSPATTTSSSSKSASSTSSSSTKRALKSVAPRPATLPGQVGSACENNATSPLTSIASNRQADRTHRVAFSRENQAIPPRPNGLSIFNPVNSNDPKAAKSVKQVIKCKLSKVYKKFKSRQQRREKLIKHQIDEQIKKTYLTSWQAYNALQALRLPDSVLRLANQPSTILAPTAKMTSMGQMLQNQATNMPMQVFYIDPANLIQYSNRICPQQVHEYRKNADKLPSTASSKKSSAASYDAYEIMDVLVNSIKTNVVITRNAHRPAQSSSGQPHNGGAGGQNNNSSDTSNLNSPAASPQVSYYSHSVNSNQPGIVSTQLHLQAKSYQDSLRKFYLEDKDRVLKELEELKKGPSEEQLIANYLYV